MKIFVVLGLLSRFASAAECMLGDETSFIQTQQSVRPADERPGVRSKTIELLKKEAIKQLVDSAEVAALKQAENEVGEEAEEEDQIPLLADRFIPEEPIVLAPDVDPAYESAMASANAVTDTQVMDEGLVTSAWETNLAKTRNKIEMDAGDSIAFKQKIHDKRLAQDAQTEEQLAEDRKAVKAALDADSQAVHKAFGRRIAVKQAALAKVTKAKEAWEAHVIKKNQAEVAAAAGKAQGHAEGLEDAAQKMDEWQDAVVDAAVAKRHATMKAAVAGHVAAEQAVIDQDDIVEELAPAAAAASEALEAAAAEDK